MAALQVLPPDAGNERMMEAMQADGACIVEGLLSREDVDRTMAELKPFVENTESGRDNFTGRNTRRTGALVARSPACRDIVMNSKIIDYSNEFLLRFADRVILHLTQTIYIGPGQGAQLLHRDRLAWGKYLPREIEPQFNTIWALTDFTRENGATRVVPGSHTWAWRQEPDDDQICQAEMEKGSVLLYSGSVIHSGGENRSDDWRMGLNITYCLGWLRQEENQYLSCPPRIARDLDPDLQDLLGYTQGNFALGYYSDPEDDSVGGTLPPEFAVGSKPRKPVTNQPD